MFIHTKKIPRRSFNIEKTPRSSLNVDRHRRWGERSLAGIRECSSRCRDSAWVWKVTVLPLLLWVWLHCIVFRSSSDINPFDQLFCGSDGTCHEQPDVASPRTVYSAWNKGQYDLWWKYYETLNHRVEVYADKRQHMYDNNNNNNKLNHDNQGTTRPLILLGDSITESWSGTGLGIPKPRASGVAAVLETELSSSSGLDPVVLAIGGDQTQHLLYRLQNGHMRAAQLSSSSNNSGGGELFYDPSAIFVVMIGTNNLGSGELPEPTTRGILAVVEYILNETAGVGCHVMLFQVLPRGDGKRVLPKLCPPRCSNDTSQTPYSSFLPPIRTVNEALAEGVAQLGKTYSVSDDESSSSQPRIRLVDCGSEFLNEKYDDQRGFTVGGNNYEIRNELMPDLLHPNAMGHRILAKCIRDYIGQTQTDG